MRRLLIGILSAAGMIVLVLDAKTGTQGALEGVELCLKVVIPSLLPFIVLSSIWGSHSGGHKSLLLLPLYRATGIPPEQSSILLLGMLGGYPVGAKNVSDTYKRGEISKETAQRLLGFCNNAGPSFIFGLLSGFFPGIQYLFAIWIIQILSAIITGIILPHKTAASKHTNYTAPPPLTSLFFHSLKTMAAICGWVILFRTIYQFISKYLLQRCSNVFGILLMGLLELTNGCLLLDHIHNVELRFVLCNILLSFGGLCIWLQTSSVTEGLEKKVFYRGKIIQTGIAIVLSLLFIIIV